MKCSVCLLIKRNRQNNRVVLKIFGMGSGLSR